MNSYPNHHRHSKSSIYITFFFLHSHTSLFRCLRVSLKYFSISFSYMKTTKAAAATSTHQPISFSFISTYFPFLDKQDTLETIFSTLKSFSYSFFLCRLCNVFFSLILSRSSQNFTMYLIFSILFILHFLYLRLPNIPIWC